jgi:hypothetical protein
VIFLSAHCIAWLIAILLDELAISVNAGFTALWRGIFIIALLRACKTTSLALLFSAFWIYTQKVLRYSLG